MRSGNFCWKSWGLISWISLQLPMASLCWAAQPPSTTTTTAQTTTTTIKTTTPTVSNADLPVIRFSASNSWSEPFAIYDRKKELKGGAVKEFMDALAEKMGRRPSYLTLPRKVVDGAAKKGSIDARCYVMESWVEDSAAYEWSKPMFDIVNVIAFPIGVTPVKKLEDLKGKTLGTVLGYRYPSLDPLFVEDGIKRSDAISETANIQKLIVGRTQYAIVEASEFAWHLKSKGKEKFNTKDFFEIERYPVKCAVVKNGAIAIQDMDRAIDKLRQEGFFKKLTTKYEIQ